MLPEPSKTMAISVPGQDGRAGQVGMCFVQEQGQDILPFSRTNTCLKPQGPFQWRSHQRSQE